MIRHGVFTAWMLLGVVSAAMADDRQDDKQNVIPPLLRDEIVRGSR